MKLLWLSHFIPYPPRGGSFQRSFNLIRQISKSYETFLVALNLQGETSERAKEYATELKKYCAEVEFWNLPYAWKGARWWAELALSPLYRQPYGSTALRSPKLAAQWQRTLARHPGALVHFDSLDLSLFVPPTEGFKKVLNHHNCESAMTFRRAEKEPNLLKKYYLRSQARKLARLEGETCHRFDVNVTVSELDAQILSSRDARAHFHVVENGTDTSYFIPSPEKPEPKSLIFAGSFNWYPNISAVEFFERTIWPRIKSRCPDVRLYLAGQRPPKSVLMLAEHDPQIRVVADPPDMRPWVARASVFVCPVIDGGGTRLKILDAMAMGKAVVSTRVGAEGLEVKDEESILLADDPDGFADATLRVLESESLRNSLGGEGRKVVEQNYSWDILGERLRQAYQCALGPKECPQRILVPAGA